MKLSGNTILITGGATGIGYALAERFLSSGNRVVVCGRREEKLSAVRASHPGVETRVCDVADEDERRRLYEWAVAAFPDLNVLVNNAGVQRRVRLTDREDWTATRSEIAINFEAPVHLTRLFTPHLLGQDEAAIINVTSGLAFAPLANVPVYCATKAALHSFTLSLRHQLRAASVEVVEIVPPAVDTDLGGVGQHTFGVDTNEFADAVFEGLRRGENEIAYGTALEASRASRNELTEISRSMNEKFV